MYNTLAYTLKTSDGMIHKLQILNVGPKIQYSGVTYTAFQYLPDLT